ncbi:MAG: DUF4177 domain-containing protein [Alkalilacustris sp.]
MVPFEYKVVPAPARPPKVRGLRATEDRFAHALTEALNAEAAEGWEYVRAESLPCEERTGFFSGRITVTQQTMLVFRRALAPAGAVGAAAPAPVGMPQAEPAARAPIPAQGPAPGPAPAVSEGDGLRALPARTTAPRLAPYTTPPARREPALRPAASPPARPEAQGPRPVPRDD